MLYRVTLTGADDSVEPIELRKLWEAYPFVEWGILIGSQTGHRFPSTEWIEKLVEERFQTNNQMPLALHICGGHLRSIASGDPKLEDKLGVKYCCFDRVQLNWHGEKQHSSVAENVLGSFCKLGIHGWEPEIIFQLDGVNDDLIMRAAARFRVSGLFDKSHGAGVLPDSWPVPRNEFSCGYAGGIGPENITEELCKICALPKTAVRGFWVDMETKLYSGFTFDLKKCQSVLEQAKPFIPGFTL